MHRLLPLLALALLPAAVAAPVPPGGRVEFGANGLLARADLEKVALGSHLVLNEDGKPRDDDEEREEPKRAEKPDAPPRPNRYDVAVHLPWAKFRAGEPMPAYFVLRNNRDSTLGLRSSIDLSGTTPELHGSGMTIGLRERATGKSVVGPLVGATNCGGGSLVDVPPFGFYCVRGDLNRLAGGALAPGEYEVDWRCGRFRAAPVRFTVVPSDAKPAPLAKRPRLQFYHLMPGPDCEHPERAGEPFRWTDCQTDPVRAESMAAALAVGSSGAYVPDVRTISAADKFVEARAVWKPYRDGDRVCVTLRAVPPHTEVHFAEQPQLFLQVETPGEAWSERWASPADGKRFERERAVLVTPLTIEARLPEGWREHLGASGTARVSVLVASKRVEFPRGPDALAEKVAERTSGEDRPSVWSGVVRTDATELRLPPHVPVTPQP